MSKQMPSFKCPFDSPSVDEFEYAGNDRFAAVYNVAPILAGHTLVITRRHVVDIRDITEDELAGLTVFARAVTQLLLDEFTADSFDWTVQNGEAAGQTVPHVHLHVIPRYSGDLEAPGDWYPLLENSNLSGDEIGQLDSDSRPRLSGAERVAIVERLRSAAAARGLTRRRIG